MTDTKDERIAELERENARLHNGLKLAQRVTSQWQSDHEAAERRADALERAERRAEALERAERRAEALERAERRTGGTPGDTP
jgi:uncharacterized membrane protein YccC